MDNILMRRREMIPSDWAVEWDYTQGLPTNPPFAFASSGVYTTPSIVSNGLQFTTGSTGSASYNCADDVSSGVLEVTVCAKSIAPKDRQVAQFRFGNSSNCVFICFYVNSAGVLRIIVWDNSTYSSCTVVTDVSFDTFYTVKVVLKGTTADIYVNDTLYISDYDTSKPLYKGKTKFGQQNANNAYALYQMFRFKTTGV